MKKQALGIAVDGRIIRIAHLVRDKKSIAVSFLETDTLPADLEDHTSPLLAKEETDGADSTEVLFGYEQQNRDRAAGLSGATVQENANVLYRLIKKFTLHRIPIAFNIPASMVSFQELNTTLDYDKNVFKGNLLKKITQWKSGFNSLENVHVVERSDGTLINVALNQPQSPALLSALEQINHFVGGNLLLSSMAPNEVALCNLARKSYHFKDDKEINVIIQIESEFSRIIFMRGPELLSVAPIISEPISSEINQIIASKILFELDNQNISQLANILLASQAINNESKEFFEAKFSQSRVGFIVSQPLAEYLTNQFTREDLSEYAVPISLAWQILVHNDNAFIDANLLPHNIIDQQRALKLSTAGYILLVLLGISAFAFTWQILAKTTESNRLRRENQRYEEQILNNQETVERVRRLEREINNLSQSLTLSDSLSKGFDDVLTFLDKANSSVQKTEQVWVQKIEKNPTGFTLFGNALQRKAIPLFSNTLGESIVRKVTREDVNSRPIFQFEMQAMWPRKSFSDFFAPEDNSNAMVKTEQENPAVEAAEKSADLVTTQEDSGKTALANEPSAAPDSEIPYALLASLSHPGKKPAPLSANTASIRAGAGESEPADLPFTIRLASFADIESAEAQSQIYRDKGYQVFLTQAAADRDSLPIWICLGRFAREGEAEQMLYEVQQFEAGDYYVVSLLQPTEFAENTAVPDTTPLPVSLATESVQTLQVWESEAEPELVQSAPIQQAAPAESDEEPIFQSPQPQITTQTPELTHGTYSVQISVHAVQFSAAQEVSFFQRHGVEAYVIERPDVDPVVPYWVCTGSFGDRQTAVERMETLNRRLHREYKIIEL